MGATWMNHHWDDRGVLPYSFAVCLYSPESVEPKSCPSRPCERAYGEEERDLGTWLHGQRRSAVNERLTPDEVASLDQGCRVEYLARASPPNMEPPIPIANPLSYLIDKIDASLPAGG